MAARPAPCGGRRALHSAAAAAAAIAAADTGLVERARAEGGSERLRGVPGLRSDSKVAHALDAVKWDAEWPYDESDFRRLDRGDDSIFYAEPKLVKHIDDRAIAALTAFYAAVFPRDRPFAALDLCSSWVSHYPALPKPVRLAASGMNEEELRRNAQATEHSVRDLNSDPRLPYGDAEFDVVTNTVSVDYLTRPREVFREVARVLKPGGLAVVAFSNRLFFSKAIARWTSLDDADRAEMVASYFHFAGFAGPGSFRDLAVADISPGPRWPLGDAGDPMFVVSAVRA